MNEFKMRQKSVGLSENPTIESLNKRILELEVENKLLKEIKDEQLNAQDLLLKETHHRIKNNMNTIINMFEIQMSMSSNKELIYSLDQARKRINSMLNIYTMLFMSKDYMHIETKKYIEKLIFELSDLDNPYVMTSSDIENFELDSKILFPVGIIINELVTNCFKHAFPNNKSGTIKISLYKLNDIATLSVSDDGIGKNISTKKGFGSLLIDSLVEQLYGNMEVTSSDLGTEYIIKFSTKLPYSD